MHMIPFDAGPSWSLLKTHLFNLLFSHLCISYHWMNPKNIRFIEDLSSLKSLAIESTRTFDLSPIETCTRLSYLNIVCNVSKQTQLDLSRLPLQTYLAADDDQLGSIYTNQTLRHLTITGYRGVDLQKIQGKRIERITIDGSKTLTSLKGLNHLEKLKLIEIERCPKLERPSRYIDDSSVTVLVDGKKLA